MSLEEKVGQLFLVYFEGEKVNANVEQLLQEAKIGGVILYNWANGLESPEQVQELCQELQFFACKSIKIPLLIGVDQEGGIVARLEKGFTEFPGNAALGRAKEPKLAYEAARSMGKEMQSVGIHLNFSPVVDVNNNPENPIIGIRAFGQDPETVFQFAKQAMEGYQSVGVISCLKHFPGHGDVTVDSHKKLPIVTKSLAELLCCELYPYKQLVKEAPMIMTAHVLFPQLDPHNCATLSPRILQEILRKQLHYQGVLITDSLSMQGVLEGYEHIEAVALQALKAGNDLLLIGGKDLQSKQEESSLYQMTHLIKAVVHAVKKGEISEKRIDASVRRILKLKKNAGLFEQDAKPRFSQEIRRCKDHLQLAREIAYRSISIKKWKQMAMQKKSVAIVAPKLLKQKIEQSGLITLGNLSTLYLFEGLEPTQEFQTELLEKFKNHHLVLFCSYNAWKNPKQLQLLQTVSQLKDTVCIATRDPYDLDIKNDSIIQFATSSPTTCALQVVSEYLKDETSPFSLSQKQAEEIGKQIWKNECNCRIDQLTFWHEKEPFPSIGIGHFIWPPEEYQGPFSEGRFHKFLLFAKSQGAEVPSWLFQRTCSPWSTREAFYHAFHSEKMQELRNFLVATVSFQAKYMMQRLNRTFREIILAVPENEREILIHRFFSVGSTKKGPYILIDYLNFKHEGTNSKERYKNQGWGLLQVLQEMDPQETKKDPAYAFAEAAKRVLTRRIENSPNREIEETRFPGWINRLHTYYLSK